MGLCLSFHWFRYHAIVSIKTGFYRILRCIPERILCPGDIGKRILHIAGTRGIVDKGDGDTGYLHEGGGKFEEIDAPAIRDIEHTLGIAFHRPDVCLHNIFYKREVPGLLPVAVNDR